MYTSVAVCDACWFAHEFVDELISYFCSTNLVTILMLIYVDMLIPFFAVFML